MRRITLAASETWMLIGALVLCVQCTGCMTSLHRAVPVSRIPPELLAPPRDAREPLDFALLRQPPVAEYVAAPDDILGIYVQQVLGAGQEPLVQFPPPVENVEAPVVGQPVEVQPDGTIQLPLIPPLRVAGMTLPEIRAAIRREYTVDRNILQPGRDYIVVTLIRPRAHQVVVVRQDIPAPAPTLLNRNAVLYAKSGSAAVLEMPPGENDVLHALSATGGLPGIEAYNVVWILRGARRGVMRDAMINELQQGRAPTDLTEVPPNIVKIPLWTFPGAPLPFGPADVILQDGDVVFIESRDEEHFFVGGLLQGGQFPLPRDYDLDVVGAIAIANGNLAGPAGINAPAFNFRSGPGNIIPPSRVLVVRTLPSGERLKIHVDLKEAMHNSRERLLIQPRDMVILAYTPGESFLNVVMNYVNVSYVIPNN